MHEVRGSHGPLGSYMSTAQKPQFTLTFTRRTSDNRRSGRGLGRQHDSLSGVPNWRICASGAAGCGRSPNYVSADSWVLGSGVGVPRGATCLGTSPGMAGNAAACARWAACGSPPRTQLDARRAGAVKCDHLCFLQAMATQPAVARVRNFFKCSSRLPGVLPIE